MGEDFYPALPASHTAHIANAAFTTLLMGVLACPDWCVARCSLLAAAADASSRWRLLLAPAAGGLVSFQSVRHVRCGLWPAVLRSTAASACLPCCRDMFHSDHGSSHLHAAARAVSGEQTPLPAVLAQPSAFRGWLLSPYAEPTQVALPKTCAVLPPGLPACCDFPVLPSPICRRPGVCV